MFSSMMLYLCFIAAGVFVGARGLKSDKEYRWIGSLQTAALLILIFTMGAKIGADDRVLASIGALGVRALIITVFSVIGSVAAVFAARKLMRLDSRGVRGIRRPEDEKPIGDKLCKSEGNVSEELLNGDDAESFGTEKGKICGGEIR